jgi:transposase
MKILAIDLGKFKSVACVYESSTGEHSFTTISTKLSAIHDLLATHQPQRVVIEIGSAAGWIHDMALTMGLQIQVANPNHEAWRWKNVKRKTDKDDALKLAQLSAMNQLPTLQLPSAKVRQWRSLIGYRNTLVARRTAIKNHIRSILDRQGMSWPGGKSGWTDKSIAALKVIAWFAKKAKPDDLWRFELHMELEAMARCRRSSTRWKSSLTNWLRPTPASNSCRPFLALVHGWRKWSSLSSTTPSDSRTPNRWGPMQV